MLVDFGLAPVADERFDVLGGNNLQSGTFVDFGRYLLVNLVQLVSPNFA